MGAALAAVLAFVPVTASSEELSFPTGEGGWPSVTTEAAGWRSAALDAALDFAGEHRSSHLVVLVGGRLLAERLYPMPEPSERYARMLAGRTDEGHPIEDVASVQKSVAAVLAAIAEGRGLLEPDAPVSRYLGAGWSRAGAEQEAAITVRHLMAMTSGLDPQRRFVAPAGTAWSYNTNVYSRLVAVLEAVTGRDIESLSREWLTGPLGMDDSRWQVREWVTPEMDANRYGFTTTARDLARFGLLVLAGGRWGEQRLIEERLLDRALESSQELNPSYGLLWWLNGRERIVLFESPAPRPGPLLANAPDDLVAALGALGRKVWVVPSRELVVVRLGDAPGADFDEELWRRLSTAMPTPTTGSGAAAGR